MKVFIDSGDVQAIKKAAETGLVSGVTTNPSKIARTGRKFFDVLKDICQIIPDHISAEVMAEDARGMVEEALVIKEIGPQIAIKVPMNVEGLKAVPILEKEENIRVNVTMCFSPTQALLAMKTGASYLTIVLSRMDAFANESEILVADTMTIKHNYGFQTHIIAGSAKTQNHLLACARSGVDIVTMPDSLFFQMFKHPLTDIALEGFEKDWAKVPK